MKHQYIYWSLKIWKQKSSLNYSARTSFDYASCNTKVHSFFSTTSLEMETPLLSLSLFFRPLQLTYYPLAMYMREKERERERCTCEFWRGVCFKESFFLCISHGKWKNRKSQSTENNREKMPPSIYPFKNNDPLLSTSSATYLKFLVHNYKIIFATVG